MNGAASHRAPIIRCSERKRVDGPSPCQRGIVIYGYRTPHAFTEPITSDIPALVTHGEYLTHLHSDHVVGLPDLWLSGWLRTRFGRARAAARGGGTGRDRGHDGRAPVCISR